MGWNNEKKIVVVEQKINKNEIVKFKEEVDALKKKKNRLEADILALQDKMGGISSETQKNCDEMTAKAKKILEQAEVKGQEVDKKLITAEEVAKEAEVKLEKINAYVEKQEKLIKAEQEANAVRNQELINIHNQNIAFEKELAAAKADLNHLKKEVEVQAGKNEAFAKTLTEREQAVAEREASCKLSEEKVEDRSEEISRIVMDFNESSAEKSKKIFEAEEAVKKREIVVQAQLDSIAEKKLELSKLIIESESIKKRAEESARKAQEKTQEMVEQEKSLLEILGKFDKK